jgi:uncharacterized Zn-binding protein involved in type VI secretion
MYFPVAKAGSIRACGAVILPFAPASNVFVNLFPICVVGSFDSHGGVAVTGSPTVFANMLPICRLGDINDVCKWVYPHHYAQPIVLGDINVFST